MQKFKPQYSRLLFIDKKIGEGVYPTCGSLAEEWEVSEKTIRRDIEYMRYSLKAPIEYDAKNRGFYYTEKNYRLPAIDIKESDLFAICIAEKALKQYENTPLYGRLQAVFEKIEQSLPEKVSVRPSWLDSKVSIFPDATTKINPAIWESVFTALRESKTLMIAHQVPGYGKPAQREIDPYHVINYQGEWYAIAFCHKKQKVLTFAVSRIKHAEILDKGFLIPEDFSISEIMGSHFGIHHGEKEYTVKIEFSPDDAPYIMERDWHPTQSIKENKDGSIVLSLTTNHLFGVKRWVLSFGSGARVIQPKQLKDEIIRELKAGLRKHTTT